MLELTEMAMAITSPMPKQKKQPAFWSYDPDMEDSGWQHVPVAIRLEVEALMAEIRAAIPDDFRFCVTFCGREFSIALEYEDGPLAGSMLGSERFETRVELFQRLAEIDWDDLRGDALKMPKIFDVMLEDAAQRPINIPSSKEAAKRWGKQLEAMLGKAHRMSPTPAFAAVLRESTGRFEVKGYDTKDEMLFDFTNALTCQYEVLAVLEAGAEVPFPQIESYKRQAIDQLRPDSISRAKAEGRFF